MIQPKEEMLKLQQRKEEKLKMRNRPHKIMFEGS